MKTTNDNNISQGTICQLIEHLVGLPSTKKAMDFLMSDNDRTTAKQIELTAIPAPSFQEKNRAAWMADRFRNLGLQDVQIDHEGNVLGIFPGIITDSKMVISAHLDTVFPEGTNTKAVIKNGIIYAPGIADDGRGLAVLLTIIRAMNEAGIKPLHSVLFAATVGEEGLGDLRGVKHLFESSEDIGGFISIEPGDPTKITCTAVGSRRYKIRFTGPGGHSFSQFGTPSAIHALGRAIAAISEIKVPEKPATTFTVGTISGGTSINTIAQDAQMCLDMRSVSARSLQTLEKIAIACVKQAVDDENQRWNCEKKIRVDFEKVGDRPAGAQSSDDLIVRTASAVVQALGFRPSLDAASTDSNVPINLKIPAVTLGGGGVSGNEHTLEEFFNPENGYIGAQSVFITLLALSGTDETESILFKK
ncbi:M20/M25/M40 family metallo-hydrolase [Heyndrickxia acidiproducens]|uniref:M20/M25/M40 family metallo-hydrolase n=1 Tax=Heyndrickxia acidiproducens TaxID=1121084 RepID=UPI0003676672|nr:M20/M25/M40 family metallo-hydrolase [Heyndrickxia acidiproducens]